MEEKINPYGDWNSNSICITDLGYNDYLQEWNDMTAYLLGNATTQSFNDHLHDEFSDNFHETCAKP